MFIMMEPRQVSCHVTGKEVLFVGTAYKCGEALCGKMWKACCIIFWVNCGISNTSVANHVYNTGVLYSCISCI